MEFNSLSRALNTRLWMTLKSMVRITHFVVTRVTVCVCVKEVVRLRWLLVATKSSKKPVALSSPLYSE